MTTIVTRAGKGSPLTNTEVDSNFSNLNSDKQEVLAEGAFVNGDKTKLDGIEAGATANQTAQEIATAIDADATAEATLKSALGLGTAAYTASTDYATAAQGSLADSAIQPADVSEILAPTRHSIRPSLLLDFANSKTLDPRITFSRSSTATYYDGKTHAKAEENLFQYSQEFDNAYWTKTRLTVTANATTAPDGTSTAESTEQTVGQTASGFVGKSITVGNFTYTQSIYAKANTKNFVVLAENLEDSSVRTTWFDLSSGTVGTTNANHTAAIASVGNGWYRCSITYTIASAYAGYALFYHADSDNSTIVTDSGGIYLWGAQVEQRSSVTAYTPTTSQPITNYIPVLQTAASGTARFDHDPVTGESKGLLIEEQRTNLLTYSEDFANAWAKVNTTITANTIVCPDGTLTGSLFTRNSTSAAYVTKVVSKSSSALPYVFSIYAKKQVGNYFAMRIQGAYPGMANVVFNLDTGAIFSGPSVYAGSYGAFSSASASSVDCGNGWFRFILACTTDTASGIQSVYSFNSNGVLIDGADSVANSSGFVWGAQLEEGSFPTSYIPTSGSQVTRSADSASMTGTNFSSWYRQDEGSIYASASSSGGVYASVVSFENDASNYIRIQLRDGYKRYTQMYYNGNAEVYLTDLTGTAGETRNIGVGYKINDYYTIDNAVSQQTDTSCSVPYLNKLYIGKLSSVNELNGHIRKLAYYPTRLTNAELVSLTEA